MRWEYLWLKLAIELDNGNVRVIETSKRVAWSVRGIGHYAYDAMPQGYRVTPAPSGMVGLSGPQIADWLYPHAWTGALDTLGGEGWELVNVLPLAGDPRIVSLRKSQSNLGEMEAQLWLFKRERLGDEVATDEEE